MIGHFQRMVGNQFIILKTGKGKESIISCTFSMCTEPIQNQIVDEGQSRFINIL